MELCTLCPDGLGACAFSFVFGVGTAILALVFLANILGLGSRD